MSPAWTSKVSIFPRSFSPVCPHVCDDAPGHTRSAASEPPWPEPQAFGPPRGDDAAVSENLEGQHHSCSAPPLSGTSGIRPQPVAAEDHAAGRFHRLHGNVHHVADGAVTAIDAVAALSRALPHGQGLDHLYLSHAGDRIVLGQHDGHGHAAAARGHQSPEPHSRLPH